MSLPRSLHETYDRTLHEMDTENFQFLMKTFKLIAFNEPRFTITQICKILSEGDIITTEDRILDQCKYFITKSDDDLYFQFSHNAIKEFLLSNRLESLSPSRYESAESAEPEG